MKTEYIKSPINYIGNKYKLLPQIIPQFPDKINTFVDLFGGSGTVILNANAEHYIYNDIVNYVGDILEGIQLDNINDTLTIIKNIINEFSLSKTNKNGFEQLRLEYNQGRNDWLTLYVLMCYSFNYQFRFNNAHKYNSSFGKDRSCYNPNIENNLKLTKKRIDNMDITFMSDNFKDFDFSDFDSNDFVYIDPPYFNSTGNYNDGKRGFEGWDFEYEKELRNLLIELNNQNVRWALSNNFATNETLNAWCDDNGFKVYHLSNTYGNCNYQKLDKISKDIEVLITNY